MHLIATALPPSNQDLYLHIRVVIGILVGLCITTLLSGLARFVQHPKRQQISVLHLGWALVMLIWVIHFWWWEYRLTLVQQWNFPRYSFVILYGILLYSLCTLLFPSDLSDYEGYEDYFISRRRWFFALRAAAFVADIFDTYMKGPLYLQTFGAAYPVRIAINLAICGIGMFSENRRVQFALLAVALIYRVFLIFWLYDIVG
jgi:hypothetical protein